MTIEARIDVTGEVAVGDQEAPQGPQNRDAGRATGIPDHAARCGKCGKWWTGLRVEHCTVCHESFTASRSGDLHRVGEHGVTDGPDRRRCLTEAEMRSGYTDSEGEFHKRTMLPNAQGIWTTGQHDPRWA